MIIMCESLEKKSELYIYLDMIQFTTNYFHIVNFYENILL